MKIMRQWDTILIIAGPKKVKHAIYKNPGGLDTLMNINEMSQ